MPFHIIKSSRIYEGRGYNGPTCVLAGIEGGKLYNTIEEAMKDAELMSEHNNIGFITVDTNTRVEVLHSYKARWKS